MLFLLNVNVPAGERNWGPSFAPHSTKGISSLISYPLVQVIVIYNSASIVTLDYRRRLFSITSFHVELRNRLKKNVELRRIIRCIFSWKTESHNSKRSSQRWIYRQAYFIPRLSLCQTWVDRCLWVRKGDHVRDSNQLGLLQQWSFVSVGNMRSVFSDQTRGVIM